MLSLYVSLAAIVIVLVGYLAYRYALV